MPWIICRHYVARVSGKKGKHPIAALHAIQVVQQFTNRACHAIAALHCSTIHQSFRTPPSNSLENVHEPIPEEFLVHGLANEDNLGHLLLVFAPRPSIILVTDVHHRVEDVLVWMTLHSQDRFDSED